MFLLSKNGCKRRARIGALGFRSKPLSAQARTPSRPSGASKEQGAKNEGGTGTGGKPPADRANFAAHRHAKTLVAGHNGREKW